MSSSNENWLELEEFPWLRDALVTDPWAEAAPWVRQGLGLQPVTQLLSSESPRLGAETRLPTLWDGLADERKRRQDKSSRPAPFRGVDGETNFCELAGVPVVAWSRSAASVIAVEDPGHEHDSVALWALLFALVEPAKGEFRLRRPTRLDFAPLGVKTVEYHVACPGGRPPPRLGEVVRLARTFEQFRAQWKAAGRTAAVAVAPPEIKLYLWIPGLPSVPAGPAPNPARLDLETALRADETLWRGYLTATGATSPKASLATVLKRLNQNHASLVAWHDGPRGVSRLSGPGWMLAERGKDLMWSSKGGKEVVTEAEAAERANVAASRATEVRDSLQGQKLKRTDLRDPFDVEVRELTRLWANSWLTWPEDFFGRALGYQSLADEGRRICRLVDKMDAGGWLLCVEALLERAPSHDAALEDDDSDAEYGDAEADGGGNLARGVQARSAAGSDDDRDSPSGDGHPDDPGVVPDRPGLSLADYLAEVPARCLTQVGADRDSIEAHRRLIWLANARAFLDGKRLWPGGGPAVGLGARALLRHLRSRADRTGYDALALLAGMAGVYAAPFPLNEVLFHGESGAVGRKGTAPSPFSVLVDRLQERYGSVLVAGSSPTSATPSPGAFPREAPLLMKAGLRPGQLALVGSREEVELGPWVTPATPLDAHSVAYTPDLPGRAPRQGETLLVQAFPKRVLGGVVGAATPSTMLLFSASFDPLRLPPPTQLIDSRSRSYEVTRRARTFPVTPPTATWRSERDLARPAGTSVRPLVPAVPLVSVRAAGRGAPATVHAVSARVVIDAMVYLLLLPVRYLPGSAATAATVGGSSPGGRVRGALNDIWSEVEGAGDGGGEGEGEAGGSENGPEDGGEKGDWEWPHHEPDDHQMPPPDFQPPPWDPSGFDTDHLPDIEQDDGPKSKPHRRDAYAGWYSFAHNFSRAWGIWLRMNRLLAAAASGAADSVSEESGQVVGSRGRYPMAPHPLHVLAVETLHTLFHEWEHFLQELAFTELELGSWRDAFRAWRRWKPPALDLAETLAEAAAIDRLLWLLDLDVRDRRLTSHPRRLHSRSEDLRELGMKWNPFRSDEDENDRYDRECSVRNAAKRVEAERRRVSDKSYSDFDQFRRAIPVWGFGTPPWTPEPAFPAEVAGPASTECAYWRGVDEFIGAVAAASGRPTVPDGSYAHVFEGTQDRYADYDGGVPVRLVGLDGARARRLLRALVILAQARNGRA